MRPTANSVPNVPLYILLWYTDHKCLWMSSSHSRILSQFTACNTSYSWKPFCTVISFVAMWWHFIPKIKTSKIWSVLHFMILSLLVSERKKNLLYYFLTTPRIYTYIVTEQRRIVYIRFLIRRKHYSVLVTECFNWIRNLFFKCGFRIFTAHLNLSFFYISFDLNSIVLIYHSYVTFEFTILTPHLTSTS